MSRTPSRAKTPTPQPERQCSSRFLTKQEFEDCKQRILCVFKRCSTSQFARLSILISSLTFCFRALHKFEICAIWRLLLGSAEDDPDAAEIEDWIFTECEQLLFLDDSGHCHFHNTSLRQFFSRVPIAGIDRTHQILAKATVVTQDLGQDMSTASESPLAQYASAFWPAHYAQVQSNNPGLTARVHRMLIPEASDLSCVDYPCQSLFSAVERCRTDDFSTLEKFYSVILTHRHISCLRGDSDMMQCRSTCKSAQSPSDILREKLQHLALEGRNGNRSDTNISDDWELIEPVS